MPVLKSDKLGLLIDTGGCPNRCAHCSFEGKPTRRMPYHEIRWIVQQFRELQTRGKDDKAPTHSDNARCSLCNDKL